MTYRGTVQGEFIVLENGVRLPDGTAVLVEPMAVATDHTEHADVAIVMRNGVPLFPRGALGAKADLELVNRLRDEVP